jgi:hypothetical protein
MVRALLLVAGLLGAGLFAGSALAKVTAVPAAVTFSNPRPGVYTGEIKSTRAVCRTDRRVTIFEDGNEDGREDGGDRILAKALSGTSGSYAATGDQTPSGRQLLVAVAAKVLSRYSFCRSLIRTATSGLSG